MPRKYTAVAYPAVLNQDAYLTYKMDAPTDITRLVYGGRLHNYSAGSYIDFLHSFDNGANWISLVPIERDQRALGRHSLRNGHGCPGRREDRYLFKYLIHNTFNSAQSRERPLRRSNGGRTTGQPSAEADRSTSRSAGMRSRATERWSSEASVRASRHFLRR